MNKSLQNNIPKHVAIIMDGNGRWQKKLVKKEHLDMRMELVQ